MKKLIGMFIFAGALLGMSACSEPEYEIDNLIPDEYNKILYIKDSGEQSIVLQNEEPTYNKSVSVIKGGAVPTMEAHVNISIMEQADIDSKWSNLTGRPHLLLSADCYTLSTSSLNYTAEDMFQDFTVTFNTPQIVKFIDNMKADPQYQDQKEYLKYVLPLVVSGASKTDSVNSQKNYVLFSIDNIAFSAPEQLYLVGEGVLETDNSIKFSKSGSTFTTTAQLGNGDIYLCDAATEAAARSFYTITRKGQLELGKSTYNAPVTGINKLEVNFDKSKVTTISFGEIEYFAPYQCTLNKEYDDFKIEYQGGGVFSGEGLSEWKAESWSWDNYADTRYKLRAHMVNGTVEEWARHDSANDVPSDNDVNNWSLETTHFWMANKGTGQGQWSNGQWKYHYSWHHDGTSGFTQSNNVNKPIRISVYFNGPTPTHKIELLK
ncbi:MAG: hypothetical protein LUH50_14500 [Bacteroides intestinalis]|nr:hypothetical protein [Bacteroides intestinalis]